MFKQVSLGRLEAYFLTRRRTGSELPFAIELRIPKALAPGRRH